jgi:hypothetical protein
MKKCAECGNEIRSKWAKKFCSSNCSASYNNKGVRRHGRDPGTCEYCGNRKSSADRTYCSSTCAGISRRKYITVESAQKAKRDFSRQRSAKYRAALKNQTPEDANMEKIKEIYANCPKGYEVDHVIPINKGGLHHQDNLQYLTIEENRRKRDKVLTS